MRIIKNISKRLNLLLEIARLQDKSVMSLPLIYIHMLFLKYRYHVGSRQYRTFKYWENTSKKIENHFLNEDNIKLVETINDQSQIYILRDKLILLKRLGDALGREYMDIEALSKDEFYSFVCRHDKVIVKPRTEAMGRGIKVLSGGISKESAANLQMELINERCTLAEEFVKQHEELNRIYSKAVNIIKIHTLNIYGEIKIVLNPLIQIGANGREISHGGFEIPINRENGSLYFSNNFMKDEYKTIPEDFLKGRPLPYYKEAESLAIKLAGIVPELTYVCWDIAISETGPVAIEGNGGSAAYDGCQAYYYMKTGLGAKKEYERILTYYLNRTNLNEEKIRKIQDILFYEQNMDNQDVDVIIVMGSTFCKYRVDKALAMSKGRPDMIFLVSGQGVCREQLSGTDVFARTEAEFMKAYLIEKGISPNRIMLENYADCTAENITYSLALLQASRNLLPEKEKLYIGIVTGGFHMKRVFEFLSKHSLYDMYEFVAMPAYGPHTKKDSWYKSIKGMETITNELNKVGHRDFNLDRI